jgi:hypothetical protein
VRAVEQRRHLEVADEQPVVSRRLPSDLSDCCARLRDRMGGQPDQRQRYEQPKRWRERAWNPRSILSLPLGTSRTWSSAAPRRPIVPDEDGVLGWWRARSAAPQLGSSGLVLVLSHR